MQQLDSALLANEEKPDHTDVYQGHFLEIQGHARLGDSDLSLELRETLRLNPTAQLKNRAPLGGDSLDAPSH